MTRCLVFLLALLLSGAVAAQSRLEVLQLKHAQADRVLPVLRPLLAPGGVLTGSGNRLFLRTSPQNHRELLDVLAVLDQPARRLLVSVRREGSSFQGGTETEVYGRVGGPRIEIGREPLPGASSGQGGSVVIGKRDGHHAGVHTVTTRSRRSGSGVQQVQVLEGGRAAIHVGESVPVPLNRVIAGPQGTQVLPEVVWQDLGTGFDVIPHLSGRQVTMEIEPYASSRLPGPPGTAAVERLRTTLSAPLGEWVPLGGNVDQAAQQGDDTGRWSTRRSGDDRKVWIKVDLLD